MGCGTLTERVGGEEKMGEARIKFVGSFCRSAKVSLERGNNRNSSMTLLNEAYNAPSVEGRSRSEQSSCGGGARRWGIPR